VVEQSVILGLHVKIEQRVPQCRLAGVARDGLLEGNERIPSLAKERPHLRELPMAVEPERASRENRVELRLGSIGLTGRDARRIQAEVDLRIVGREPKCALEKFDGRNPGLKRDTSMTVRDSGVGGGEVRGLGE
jgi:hypothetical protein